MIEKIEKKKRDRPICDVLVEIQNIAIKSRNAKVVALCDEALIYAKKMHARLQQNKKDLLRLAGSSIV
jgi:hypothetical protein